MTIERTPEGLEARLRPRGIGRFFSAGFLGVWLCGWAAGEAIVLWILIRGAVALLTGRPPEPGRAPLEPAIALVVGLFLILWLAFWTVGGALAIRQLLRLLWSEDRIVAGVESLEVRRRLGPIRSTIRIARGDLFGIEAIPRRARLVAETARGLQELTSLGTEAERGSVLAALRGEYRLDDGPGISRRSGALPTGWSEAVDIEGRPILVKDPRARRAQACVAWMAAAGVSAIATGTLQKIPAHPEWGALAAIVAGAAVLLGHGAWRLTMTRYEWGLESGRLTLRRRGPRGADDLFEGTVLELTESADSDGDLWYTLDAVGAPPVDPRPAATDQKVRKTIVRAMDDPVTPRRLGAWLAERTGMRLEDRATTEIRNVMWAQAIASLETSGRFGRWVASRLPKP